MMNTYNTSKSSKAHADLFHISSLEEIDGLEYLLIRNSPFLHHFLEGGVVLHQSEVATLLIDSFYGSRLQFVGEAVKLMWRLQS